MKTQQQLYVLHALSPLHVGEDQAAGAVDLPTMRERATGYPLIPGSSVKGVLREEAEEYFDGGENADEVRAAFGPPKDQAGDHRGGLIFTDAHLLALPVRSLCGTFAWVTCGRVLKRLNRDLETVGVSALPVPRVDSHRTAWIPAAANGGAPSALLPPGQKQVFLEELLLDGRSSPEASELAGRLGSWFAPGSEEAVHFFKRRLLVAHDDIFGFYTRLSLEVRARVKLGEAGTVEEGPWSEEHMPAESLLYGLVVGRPTRVIHRQNGEQEAESQPAKGVTWGAGANLKVLRRLVARSPVLRFGGLASVGLGRTRFRLVNGNGRAGEE